MVPLVVLIDGSDKLVIERLVMVAEVMVALVPTMLVIFPFVPLNVTALLVVA